MEGSLIVIIMLAIFAVVVFLKTAIVVPQQSAYVRRVYGNSLSESNPPLQ